MNIVLFLAIYCIISITLSSFIFYKVRPYLYKQFNIPSNKMRWQTIVAILLLHISIIIITISAFTLL